MQKSIKRALLLICTLTMAVAASSCTVKTGLESSNESKKLLAMGELMLETLSECDREGFKALFCETVRKADWFDEKIDAVFSLFKCDEYIGAKIADTAGGSKSWSDCGVSEWSLDAHINLIKTIVNDEKSAEYGNVRYYNIDYYWKAVDVEYPEKVGIMYFTIEFLNHGQSVNIRIDEAGVSE